MKKFFTLLLALTAMVSLNAGSMYLKNNWNGGNESWIELEDAGDGDFTGVGVFGGSDFAINTTASDEGARIIKAENATATLNYEPAELAAGDQVFFIYNNDNYNAYNPKQSGLQAMIVNKANYAIFENGAWKNMIEDDGSFSTNANAYIDGKNIQIIKGNEIKQIKLENVKGMIDNVDAEIAVGDSAMFIFVPDMVNAYDEKESGLFAMINWKKGYALGIDGSWKNMTEDDGSFSTYANAYVDGKNVQIAKGNEIKQIKIENVIGMIQGEDAELAVGDSAMFIFVPDMYNQYNEKESGMFAMINWKKGYAIKIGEQWKNFTEDEEDWWSYDGMKFEGKTVQLVHGNKISDIKPENISAFFNYDAAELSEGDSVIYVFRPSLVNQYNEKESGLQAMITKKNGYAIHGTWGEKFASWKNMPKYDEESFFISNVLYDGQNVQILTGKEIYNIKPENIQALMLADYNDAVLEAGDSVLFSFTPDARSAYDETQSGLMALIIKKHGYYLQAFFGAKELSWKELTNDGDGKWSIKDVVFDGGRVAINNFASTVGARNIEAKNIQGYLENEFADLFKGDSIIYIFDPENVAAMDPSKSGLSAMITWKAGYAVKRGDVWKDMAVDTEDADWWTMSDLLFDGKAIQLANGKEVRTIKPENISAYINYDDAVLSAGDTVMFVYRPSLYNHYNEAESGMNAHIIYKNGYAVHSTWGEKTASWKNMTVDPEDADWWTLDKMYFDGKDIQVINGSEISTIKPENILAYIDYDAAELSEGDTVMFIFRPSLTNRYNEKESGMYAHILVKNGYAIKGFWGEKTASWKNMILDENDKDKDTYLLENVIFEGEDVQFVSNEGIRTIKVENIKAYMLPTYEDAVLEEGDEIVFMYTPSAYNHYDEKESGLSALIVKKNEGDAVENITVGAKAMKVMIDGQLFIISNGKTYNVAGALVK